MISQRYVGFENENSYRNYPFSETAPMFDLSGVPFPTDVFVDAFLYPVVSERTGLELKSVDFGRGGTVDVVLSGSGEILEGSEDGGSVELYNVLGRHAGTLMCGPGWKRESAAGRRLEFSGLSFSPSAVSVIVHDGVMAFTHGSFVTSRRNARFVGDGCITPVLTATRRGPELSFDVQDDSVRDGSRAVRQIVFAAVGDTVFDIQRGQSDNTVLLSTPLLDREDVCWQAHMEDEVSAIVDTCPSEGGQDPQCPGRFVPPKHEEIAVCPSPAGSINVVSDDVVGLRNPVHVTTVSGAQRMNSPRMSSGMGGDAAMSEASRLLSRQTQVGNGIRISIPGIGNGG